MARQGFTERDWKLFRSKVPDWQEAFMEKLNKEYIELLSGEGNPSDKFWKLEKKKKKDEKKAGVQLDMRRSNLIYNLLSLLNEGAISLSDLEGFSEELLETIDAFTNRHFRE